MSWSWSKKPYYFKDKYSFEERFDEKKKYPEICEKDINDTSFQIVVVINVNMTMCEFVIK